MSHVKFPKFAHVILTQDAVAMAIVGSAAARHFVGVMMSELR